MNERVGAVDRAIHMALRGEIDDRADVVKLQEPQRQIKVADIAFHERVAIVTLDRYKVLQIARVGELIEVHDGLLALREPLENEIRSYKPCAAGNKYSHVKSSPLARRILA